MSLNSPDPLFRYIQLEACWIASNLVYSDDLDLILSYGAYGNPKFLDVIKNMIANSDVQMLDQILFMLGNVTGTSKVYRQLVRDKIDLIKIVYSAMR